jgi:hypothetical protein
MVKKDFMKQRRQASVLSQISQRIKLSIPRSNQSNNMEKFRSDEEHKYVGMP